MKNTTNPPIPPINPPSSSMFEDFLHAVENGGKEKGAVYWHFNQPVYDQLLESIANS